jgi:hypothetical protein
MRPKKYLFLTANKNSVGETSKAPCINILKRFAKCTINPLKISGNWHSRFLFLVCKFPNLYCQLENFELRKFLKKSQSLNFKLTSGSIWTLAENSCIRKLFFGVLIKSQVSKSHFWTVAWTYFWEIKKSVRGIVAKRTWIIAFSQQVFPKFESPEITLFV